MTCATCPHYSPLQGQCHERSPRAVLVGVDPERGPLFASAFPPMPKDGWCSRHPERRAVVDLAHQDALAKRSN